MASTAALDRAVAHWSFGWLPSDRLPGVALEALEHGLESPSMVELASADSTAGPRLEGLFEKALAELGRSFLAKPEAGRIIARDYAKQICEGTVTPVDGASLACARIS